MTQRDAEATKTAGAEDRSASPDDQHGRVSPDDVRGRVGPDDRRGRTAPSEDSQRSSATTRTEGSDGTGEPIGEHRRSGRLVLGADVGKKMGADPTMTEDRKLLEPTERPAFLNTDPWRALRILAEFVEGFDALASVGPAITVFGSARVDPG